MNKFKKDDTVIITKGKDSQKTGKILKVIPKKNTVLVEGLNKKSKHKKPQQDKAGGIIEKEYPISISNIMHIEPKTKKKSKVEFALNKKKKVRKLKINKVVID